MGSGGETLTPRSSGSNNKNSVPLKKVWRWKGIISIARERKRSVHGGGTVFLRKDGCWEAKLKVEETGKYRSLSAKTEKEAYRFLEEATFQQKQGTLATGPQQAVQQFLEYWLENVQRPGRGVGNYVGNKVVINKHLIPGIGQIKLHKLTAAQLQQFYANKMKEGTSASRIRSTHAVVLEALKQHQSDQEGKRVLAGSNWVKPDLVFCTPKGNFIQASTLQYQFNKLLKEIGLPHIRFHDLRHSSATLLLWGCPRGLYRRFWYTPIRNKR